VDLKSFSYAVQQIADEKGISKEKIFEAIEMAIAAAYKRDYGKRGQIIKAQINPESGKVAVKQIKIVVDESMIKSEEEILAEEEEKEKRALAAQESSEKNHKKEAVSEREEEVFVNPEEKRVRFNEEKHIMIDEAKKNKADVQPGEELEFSLEYHEDYGRIAAQTAKQVILQRIREVEREAVYEENKGKQGELISGLIQRLEGRNVFIDIGRTVGILPPEEQIPHEHYRIGERLKVLVLVVEKNPKGPIVFLSRSHPKLLKKLFEIEVPEIADGSVEIKALAREPGYRSKVAVVSHKTGVDPVGSLVGQKGIRVSTVINELGGEKIDVIEWSEDTAEFIAHALAPSKVLDVEIDEKRKEARAIVPDDQLSLAIGKGGQNVRLAAKLTGWKIDVRSSKGQALPIENAETPTEKELPPAHQQMDEASLAQNKSGPPAIEPEKAEEEKKTKEKETKKKKVSKK